MGDNGYALDLSSPVRHVATEMDRAAPASLSIEELAEGYRHVNPGDLARIKEHEGCATDQDAIVWLIGRAVEEITYQGRTTRSRVQVVANGHGWRLADGVTFEDLLYQGRKLHRAYDAHVQLRDPFNPMSGRWSANVRRNTGKDSMDELRESMREFGWVEEFPAIEDERGVVLVGHRRLAVAAELGIEPVVRRVRLGDGDEADAKRFRIAVVSNLAAKPFTPEERKDLAEYLYGEREWSQARIAEALNVTQRTISSDLRELEVTSNSPRRGRPRKSPNRKVIPEMEAEIAQAVEVGQPVPSKQLAAKYDVHPSTVEDRAREERARAEAREQTRRATGIPLVVETACTCPNCGDVHEGATTPTT
jgi:ParB-like chromosome segregation protein Spo0J